MSVAGASRWLREGPLAARVPWRTRTALEAWTASHAYPSAGTEFRIRVSHDTPRAVLLFGGDVALHRWTEDHRAEEVFGDLADMLDACDARFYNLESQLTERTQPAGTVGAFLRAQPTTIAMLRALRATAVTCANNHCVDFGSEALAESVATLEANGIATCGVPRNDRHEATVVPANRVRIGMLAYTDDWHEPEHGSARPMPAAHEPSRVIEAIAATRSEADVVVVQLHWGWEFTMYPLRTLRDLARSYVDAGAHLVICHHAHVPMGVERWRDGLIAHGLGNLYFGAKQWSSHPYGSRSFVLRVSVSERCAVQAEVVPVHTTKAGRLVASTGRTREEMLRAVAYLSQRLDADAYLFRVERNVIAMQGAIVLQDLAQRISELGGARERIRFMRCPRQRWLVGEMQRWAPAQVGRGRGGSSRRQASTGIDMPFLRDGGQLLERLRESPRDIEGADTLDRIASLGAEAAAWLRRAAPVGRVP